MVAPGSLTSAKVPVSASTIKMPSLIALKMDRKRSSLDRRRFSTAQCSIAARIARCTIDGVIEAFREIVLRAFLHRLDGDLIVTFAVNYDYRKIWMFGAYALQNINAIDARQGIV